jgi:hypothetical protein
MRGILVLALVTATAPAMADDDEPPATFHKGQLGISPRLAYGVRGIATYDNKIYCGKLDPQEATGNASVCTGRSPLSLDLEAGYGVAKHIELVLELRLGLEKDFGSTSAMDNGPRQLALSPGARFFFSEAEHLKLFVEPLLVLDFTGYKDATGNARGNDIGVRGLEGVWLDLHRTYGIYFFVGETAEFSRWLEAEFAAGFGFQGRYP